MVDPWAGYYKSSEQLNDTLAKAPLQNMQMQSARMQLAQGQRQMEDEDATRQALSSSGGDLSRAIPAVAQTGNVKALVALQQAHQSQQKGMVDNELGKQKVAMNSAQNVANAPPEMRLQTFKQEAMKLEQMFGIPSGPSIQHAEQIHAQGGPDALYAEASNAAMTLKDRIEQQWKGMEYNQKQSEFGYRQNHDTAVLGQQREIANQNNARGNEANNIGWQRNEIANGKLGVDKEKESREAALGPKLTEGQSKGAIYGTRAEQASKIIESIGKDGKVQPGLIKRVVESAPLIGEGLGTMANTTQSPQQQQIEQAQRDFVNAVLRQESGAAISPSEFENAKKQYFPQPGDSTLVIQQKKQNREIEINGLQNQAGPAMKTIPKPTTPRIGDAVDGYVYQGGDPSKPKSWRKQ